MALSDTLLIRHLPAFISKTEIEDFLTHIGAVRVVVFESKFKKQKAFATFKTKEVAAEALFRLHQKDMFGSRLVVEFAKNNASYNSKKNVDAEVEETEDEKKKKLYDTFMQNLNNWTAGLNFTQLPPYHLRYRYPPPSAEVLLNIANMLSCTTKFYTQVLHLMNKMNLPSPFEYTFPLQDNEIFNSFIIYILENSVYEGKEKKLVSSSSEIDTELESDTENMKTNVVPRKRTLPEKKSIKKRKLFKPIIRVPSKTSKISSIEEVFEKVERECPPKKIEVKIPSEILVTEISQPMEAKPQITEGFGVIYPVNKPEDEKSEYEEKTESIENYISPEELAMNRVSERDRKELPVFKNYLPGVPSRRLYIKNLSKDVTLSDLRYIFNRYFIKGTDEQETVFNISLLKKGRMKDQAFVTLQNVKQAQLALNETNGFIIKSKPMVVQYSRFGVDK